jgi:hypothetical protein
MVKTMTIVVSCLALLLLIFLDNDRNTTTCTALCMSVSLPTPSYPSRQRNAVVISRRGRRAFFNTVVAGVSSCMTVVAAASSPLPASAACLPGDLSKECIGIYKVPIQWDDQTERATIENLKKFASDLNVDQVPRLKRPKSNSVARQTLEKQQTIIQTTVLDLVTAGRLEEAGICLLGVIPKVTSAGNFLVQQSMSENENDSDSSEAIAEIRSVRLQSQYQLLLGLLGQSDVSIGQALRGDIPGTITMAVRKGDCEHTISVLVVKRVSMCGCISRSLH